MKDGNLILKPPKRLGHLPIIADMLRTTGICDVIDQVCGKDPRMRVSHSECLTFVLLGVFAGEHGLWRLAERLDPFDLETILQRPNVDLAEFHDVRLGRMCDAIYHAGPERLMSMLSLSVIRAVKLDLRVLNFDTTSLSFFGAYEDDLEDPWSPETQATLAVADIPQREPRTADHLDGDGHSAPMVVRGYAKNHRFDLKQIIFGMVVAADGGVPLYGRAMDGNASDVTVACEFLDHLRSQVEDPQSCCFVADSKGWTARTLQPALEHGLRLLSRLPRTTKLAQRLVAEFDRDAAPCRLRSHHKDRGHWSWVAYQGSDSEVEFTTEEPVPSADGKPVRAADGTLTMHAVRRVMPVRVVVCYSSELYRQKTETLAAIGKREQVRYDALVKKIQRQAFACREDAQAEGDRLKENQRFITLTVITSVVEKKLIAKRSRRGRPGKDDPAPAVTVRYGLAAKAKDASPAELAERLRIAATYVIIRHRVTGWDITDEGMLDDYAKQWRCEHGFSWLKSQAAINPMFVQTPRRIASLCFVYCIALMIHTLIQRNIRRYLHEHNVGLPYRRNKPSPDITSRFFYEIYRGLTSQVISIDGVAEKRIFGDDQWTKLGLKALGTSASAYHPVTGVLNKYNRAK